MVGSTMSMGSEGVATDETGGLISASKVNGTNVYNTQGDSLGSIYDVMIDKRSGQVAYAVMSFGGFLGIGEEYSPLPWSALSYDTRQGGYVVKIDKEALEGGPRYSESDYDRWEDPEFTRGIDDYYSRYASLGGRAL
ncbi:PRC-barrel domain-containing protein [Mesorhizobium albiziae]|uniref:PRC-barrel domain-containing protein n=1 Tax=Neomesorhizobium albiziae TaxID=335020 RepID=A0A1I4EQC6_9HYPH|nr:PRC-barrel domain-containing protein [Mesorhizobium albiziae]GLS30739.1 photosystem reaction center subunit H [Mesorhizobium albiziae]SFL07499.1 PRC-barrel domain-containing protein [Mesorhizobium albiziae]